MTLPQAVAGFAVVAALITVLPGLDTLLVLRSALLRGRGAAAWTAAGISSGVLVWGAAAAVGVAALLAASQVAYDVVRLVGAGYLLVLGVRLLAGAIHGGPRREEAVPQVRTTARRAWVAGFTTNLLNPKIGVFYVATMPQFAAAGVPPLAMGLLLAAVHVLLGTVWLGGLILGAGAASRWLRRPSVGRAIDGVAGGVLVAFGVRTALEHA